MPFFLAFIIVAHSHQIINLINLPSLTNISGFRNTTAKICDVPTGRPSLLRCSRRKFICSAKVSAVIPHPSVDSNQTMASSILIALQAYHPDMPGTLSGKT